MTREIQRLTFFVLLLAFSLSVHGQDEAGRTKADRQVVNEDRGRAYIVTSDTEEPANDTKLVGPNAPRHFCIFIGDGWTSDDLQERIATLTNLFPVRSATQRGETDKNAPSIAPYRMLPAPKGGAAVTDLSVQAVVREAIDDDIRAEIERGAVLVVYLDPALHSSLAELESGKHYLAYENTFNSDGARVRYVVIPLDVNLSETRSIARKAVLWSLIDL